MSAHVRAFTEGAKAESEKALRLLLAELELWDLEDIISYAACPKIVYQTGHAPG
jgi:hypothetical protein